MSGSGADVRQMAGGMLSQILVQMQFVGHKLPLPANGTLLEMGLNDTKTKKSYPLLSVVFDVPV